MFKRGQIIEHINGGARFRVERVTAQFAVLTSLPDGETGRFGRVRLTTLRQMARIVVDV